MLRGVFHNKKKKIFPTDLVDKPEFGLRLSLFFISARTKKRHNNKAGTLVLTRQLGLGALRERWLDAGVLYALNLETRLAGRVLSPQCLLDSAVFIYKPAG